MRTARTTLLAVTVPRLALTRPLKNKGDQMPQSNKDSKGGKSHSDNKPRPGGRSSGVSNGNKAQGRSAQSPTGPQKHGEKKTTN